MRPGEKSDRVDTSTLKARISQKFGHKKAQKYFDQLGRFLSLKTRKSEFDKFCIQTIGKENIPLHNKLVLSILKNACAKVPPLVRIKRKVGGSHSVQVANGYQRSCLQSLYGDAFSPSPRKTRSPINRNPKQRDRPSSFVPLGNAASEELASKAQEQQSATELHSLGSVPPLEVTSEEGEEVEQVAGSPGVQSRSSVIAPLGISPRCSGVYKTSSSLFASNGVNLWTCQRSGELPDTRFLKDSLKRALEMEGLGISVGCVDLLNNALDMYLKRLIEPCLTLARTRCRNMQSKQLNELQIPAPGGIRQGRLKQRADLCACASMTDFDVAMEVSPELLGANRTVLLERIRFRASG